MWRSGSSRFPSSSQRCKAARSPASLSMVTMLFCGKLPPPAMVPAPGGLTGGGNRIDLAAKRRRHKTGGAGRVGNGNRLTGHRIKPQRGQAIDADLKGAAADGDLVMAVAVRHCSQNRSIVRWANDHIVHETIVGITVVQVPESHRGGGGDGGEGDPLQGPVKVAGCAGRFAEGIGSDIRDQNGEICGHDNDIVYEVVIRINPGQILERDRGGALLVAVKGICS